MIFRVSTSQKGIFDADSKEMNGAVTSSQFNEFASFQSDFAENTNMGMKNNENNNIDYYNNNDNVSANYDNNQYCYFRCSSSHLYSYFPQNQIEKKQIR